MAKAKNVNDAKPPPSGKTLSISVSYDLLKKLRLLNTKLSPAIQALTTPNKLQNNSLTHIALNSNLENENKKELTDENEKELIDTSLVKQKLPLEEATKLFEFLCALIKRKNKKNNDEQNNDAETKKLLEILKKLKAHEILALEEYKLAVLEACRTAMCDEALESLKFDKLTHAPVFIMQKHFGMFKFKLIPTPDNRKKGSHTRLNELQKEFEVITEEENKRKQNNHFNLMRSLRAFASKLFNLPATANQSEDSKTAEEIDTGLATYKNVILDTLLYQNSGRTSAYIHEEEKKSGAAKRGRIWKRITYTLLLAWQITTSAIYNVIELAGANSLLLLIPGVTFPIALGISITLIVLSIGVEIAFGLKIFKETYGFSYLAPETKTYLHVSENQIELTDKLAKIAKDQYATQEIDRNDYQHCTRIIHLAEKDAKNKVANANSPFWSYNESIPRIIVRYGLMVVNTALAVTGSYFLGSLFIGLFVSSALVTAGTAASILSPIILPIFAICAVCVAIYNYRIAIYNLINPLAERFGAVKTQGTQLAKTLESDKQNFKMNVGDTTAFTHKGLNEQMKRLRLLQKQLPKNAEDDDEPTLSRSTSNDSLTTDSTRDTPPLPSEDEAEINSSTLRASNF